MSAKSDTGNYSVSTRFGGYKRLRRDKPVARPETRGEAIRQIEEIFAAQKWDERDKTANALMIGLEPKNELTDYTDDELKIILDDAEASGMILYQ